MISKKRKGIQSERYLKQRRRKVIWLWVLVVVAIVSIITSFSLLSKATFVQLQNVTVTNSASGVQLVTSAADVHALIEQNLVGNWWGLFSRNSILLYPKKTIEHEILQKFSRVQSVAFDADGLKGLNVVLTERAPFALACTDQTVAAKCYYMDTAGLSYAVAPQFSAGVYIHYSSTIASTTASSTSLALGKLFIAPDQLAIAKQATDYLTSMHIAVTGLITEPEHTDVVLIRDIYSTSTPAIASTTEADPATDAPTTKIYLDTTDPLDKTLNNFSQFWQSAVNKNFEYVDLRYGNDIVFKLR